MKNIGIAIPAYNEEQTVSALLESIYKQTYPKGNLSVCVADNASSDRTRFVIQQFSKAHRTLHISITHQPIHGVAPTRKCALDEAAKKRPDLLLTVDADCILPSTLSRDSSTLLNNKQNALISYHLTFPKQFLLVLHIYYKPLKIAVARLSTFLEQLLGPSLYTGCLLLPTSLYKNLYWDDVLHPLIPDDDFLLSRRLNALGTMFIRSSLEVPTSDRRFWGNPHDWVQHIHQGDYRSTKEHSKLGPPTQKMMQLAITKRIEKATDRVLQSLVEYIFLASYAPKLYIRAGKLALNIIHRLHLPQSAFQPVTERNKHDYYQHIRKKYFQPVKNIVTAYVRQP